VEQGIAKIDDARHAQRREAIGEGQWSPGLDHDHVWTEALDDLAHGAAGLLAPEHGISVEIVANEVVAPVQERREAPTHGKGRPR